MNTRRRLVRVAVIALAALAGPVAADLLAIEGPTVLLALPGAAVAGALMWQADAESAGLRGQVDELKARPPGQTKRERDIEHAQRKRADRSAQIASGRGGSLEL